MNSDIQFKSAIPSDTNTLLKNFMQFYTDLLGFAVVAGIQAGSAVAGGVAALVLASLAGTAESCAEEHHACSPDVLLPMEKTTRRERNVAVKLRIEVCSLRMAVPPALAGDMDGARALGTPWRQAEPSPTT